MDKYLGIIIPAEERACLFFNPSKPKLTPPEPPIKPRKPKPKPKT